MTTAQAPASPQPLARREISANPLPLPGAGRVKRISVIISSGAVSVLRYPVKKASAATVRTPAGPVRITSPP